ncbi:hypothetical protein, variant [Capsaspora owczarzaki ATCC 30864]|nr:hypothetical protein, variant [Capsaspora owczarzaki ATCC 30864]
MTSAERAISKVRSQELVEKGAQVAASLSGRARREALQRIAEEQERAAQFRVELTEEERMASDTKSQETQPAPVQAKAIIHTLESYGRPRGAVVGRAIGAFKSASEAGAILGLLRTLRRYGVALSQSQANVLVERFVAARCPGALIPALTMPWRYGVFPDAKHIELLVRHFTDAPVATVSAADIFRVFHSFVASFRQPTPALVDAMCSFVLTQSSADLESALDIFNFARRSGLAPYSSTATALAVALLEAGDAAGAARLLQAAATPVAPVPNISTQLEDMLLAQADAEKLGHLAPRVSPTLEELPLSLQRVAGGEEQAGLLQVAASYEEEGSELTSEQETAARKQEDAEEAVGTLRRISLEDVADSVADDILSRNASVLEIHSKAYADHVLKALERKARSDKVARMNNVQDIAALIRSVREKKEHEPVKSAAASFVNKSHPDATAVLLQGILGTASSWDEPVLAALQQTSANQRLFAAAGQHIKAARPDQVEPFRAALGRAQTATQLNEEQRALAASALQAFA